MFINSRVSVTHKPMTKKKSGTGLLFINSRGLMAPKPYDTAVQGGHWAAPGRALRMPMTLNTAMSNWGGCRRAGTRAVCLIVCGGAGKQFKARVLPSRASICVGGVDLIKGSCGPVHAPATLGLCVCSSRPCLPHSPARPTNKTVPYYFQSRRQSHHAHLQVPAGGSPTWAAGSSLISTPFTKLTAMRTRPLSCRAWGVQGLWARRGGAVGQSSASGA